jgi:hypothetical protein
MIQLDVTPECCYFQILIDTHIGKMKYREGGWGMGGREQWVLGNMILAIKAVRGKQT